MVIYWWMEFNGYKTLQKLKIWGNLRADWGEIHG